jgi:uncharacterized protein (TIGR03382 family)
MKRRAVPIVVSVLIIAALTAVKVLAFGGTILSLIASGGGTPNSTITVQSSVRATMRITSSNLYYTITGPGSDTTIRTTHRTTIGRLNNNQTFSDSWTTNNAGWPTGNYTLRLCWSRGNTSSLCDIASATTTFNSVPTLGWPLTLAALALLLGWLWRRRREFEPAVERVRS